MQGAVVEVEGVVKGRFCFTIGDRGGIEIARLGSADHNFSKLFIKAGNPAKDCYMKGFEHALRAMH